MAKASSLAGQRFGRLTAIEATGERRAGGVVWRCRCDCGCEHLARAAVLRNGQVSSCGCQQFSGIRRYQPPRDLTGERHGMLLVERLGYVLKGVRYWLCRCDCGAEATVRGKDLVHGNTKSCGCLRSALLRPEMEVRHG